MRVLSLLACSALMVGCAAESGLAPDAVGDDSGAEQDDVKADGSAGLYDYFTIRPSEDGTRSWFVQRANRKTTTCTDGVARSYCTVLTVRLADGIDDRAASDELYSVDHYRGNVPIWGAYYAPDLVRGEMHGTELVVSEIWRPGRFHSPDGVWVQLSSLGAEGTRCADASWASHCESRLNSRVAWPISVANLERPNELQPGEQELLTDPTKRLIIVGTRAYQDGLPIRELANIYYQRTSH